MKGKTLILCLCLVVFLCVHVIADDTYCDTFVEIQSDGTYNYGGHEIFISNSGGSSVYLKIDDKHYNRLSKGQPVIFDDMTILFYNVTQRIDGYNYTTGMCFSDKVGSCNDCQELEELLRECSDEDYEVYGEKVSYYVNFPMFYIFNDEEKEQISHCIGDDLYEGNCQSLEDGNSHKQVSCDYGCIDGVCVFEDYKSQCIENVCHLYENNSLEINNIEVSIEKFDTFGTRRQGYAGEYKSTANVYLSILGESVFLEDGESYKNDFIKITALNIDSSDSRPVYGKNDPSFVVLEYKKLNDYNGGDGSVDFDNDEVICTDSDGGKDYFEKAKVYGIERRSDGSLAYVDHDQFDMGDSEDVCKDSNTLYEIYCGDDSGLSVQEYDCPNGCVDGACIEKERNENTQENDVKENLQNTCNGCFVNDTCYDIGYRFDAVYCSGSKELVAQLESGNSCNNNFECSSNVCVSGECVDEGLITKIIHWFRRLFGRE